mmetsp:Transcript_33347/g.61999  ORF Transcript_33347/g.61999 Transcript_33347/m.61999 type:complete len:117 (-) Transcript_33347:183-533(-)
MDSFSGTQHPMHQNKGSRGAAAGGGGGGMSINLWPIIYGWLFRRWQGQIAMKYYNVEMFRPGYKPCRDDDNEVSSSGAGGRASSTRWNCPQCTYLNKKAQAVCSMCGIGRRPEGPR